MRIPRLILAELRHRPLHAFLTATGLVVAVTLATGFISLAEASERETRRLMRDLGYNLRLIPAATDMDRFWADGFSGETMPESYIATLAKEKRLSMNHLIAHLSRAVEVNGRRLVLTGISEEKAPPGKKKPSMIFSVGRGEVHLGFEAARILGKKRGDTVTLEGRSFQVVATLSETGSADDVKIYGNLLDVQEAVGLTGRISEIQALDCLCLEPDHDPLTLIRDEAAALLPEARVIQKAAIAETRARQRSTAERQFAFLVPFMLIACAIWVAALAMTNVRDRAEEIGVLRAIGFGAGGVAGLFLGRAAVLGLLSAVLGCFIAGQLVDTIGPSLFRVTAKNIAFDGSLWEASLVAAPLFAAVASLVPTMLAVMREPADVLRGE